MTNRTYASEMRAELERAVASYRSRAKWYGIAAAGGIAVVITAVAIVAGSGGGPGTGTKQAAAENARAHTSTPARGGVIGDLGDVHVGDPTDSVAATEARADFSVTTPDTPDANADNLAATYVDPGKAAEMDFPAPDAASKQLRPPYISVTEFPWDGGDPATEIQRDLKTAAGLGLTQESECSVGTLPAVCVSAADPSSQSDTAAAYPNAAYVRFIQGNLEVHIAGGSSVDRLLKIGESIASDANAGQASANG